MSELFDIGAKSPVQLNWEHNTPINDRLRNIVDPLADHFAVAMAEEIAGLTASDRQEMIHAAGNAYTLPYGRVGMLPPAIFGNISEDAITLKRELSVPQDDATITSMVEDYSSWAANVAMTPKGMWGRRYPLTSYPTREILTRKLTELKGITYPFQEWKASATAMQRALKDEPFFLMDAHRANRIGNAGFDYDQLNDAAKASHRGYSSYVLVMSKIPPQDTYIQGTRDYAQLPIGEYGEEAATKLAQLTVCLSDFIKDSPMVDSGVRDYLTLADETLLAEHTARTRDRFQDSVTDYAVHGIKNTLTEGVLSIAQTISFLTAEKVPGYENYDQLVQAILNSDVIEQFTRSVKAGYIGPITLSGLYMPGALAERNGKLSLSKEALSVLNPGRREWIASIAAEWATYRASGGTTEKPGVLGLVCPAAAPNGAITRSKEVFKALYASNDTE